MPADVPDAGIDHHYVDTLGSDLATTISPLGTVGPETKCAANKFKAASYRAIGEIECHSKALAQNVAVNPACLTTVEAKYTLKYAAAENVGCATGNTANSPAIEGLVDTFVNPDLVGSIPP